LVLESHRKEGTLAKPKRELEDTFLKAAEGWWEDTIKALEDLVFGPSGGESESQSEEAGEDK